MRLAVPGWHIMGLSGLAAPCARHNSVAQCTTAGNGCSTMPDPSLCTFPCWGCWGCDDVLWIQTPTGLTTCEKLLTALLDVTESTIGLIATNFSLPDGTPCLKVSPLEGAECVCALPSAWMLRLGLCWLVSVGPAGVPQRRWGLSLLSAPWRRKLAEGCVAYTPFSGAPHACSVDDALLTVPCASLPPCFFVEQTNTVTNVMWTDKLRAWYSEHIKGGLVFTHVEPKGLFGRAALRGQAVFNNDPNNDSMPKGHPRVNGVACIPLICGEHCSRNARSLTSSTVQAVLSTTNSQPHGLR